MEEGTVSRSEPAEAVSTISTGAIRWADPRRVGSPRVVWLDQAGRIDSGVSIAGLFWAAGG